MKISELPTAIKLRALKYQKECLKGDKKSNNILTAFIWEETKEGNKYWHELHNAVEFFTLERND